jgi:toxin ParE1/3/4
MSRKIHKRPRVLLDLAEQALFIGKTGPEAASRFLDAAEAAFSTLAEQPNLGGLFPMENTRLEGLRAWRIRGFNKHVVFYLVQARSIEIVRVLHGARDLDAILAAE